MNNFPLFIYGTLLDQDVLSAVLGRNVAAADFKEGYLANTLTLTYPGESFPILRTVKDSKARGQLLYNLQSEDWQRINFYEGDEYGFIEVDVLIDDTITTPALINSATDTQLFTQQPWALEHWQVHNKPDFLPKCQRYMALYGSMSIEQADVFWQAWQSE